MEGKPHRIHDALRHIVRDVRHNDLSFQIGRLKNYLLLPVNPILSEVSKVKKRFEGWVTFALSSEIAELTRFFRALHGLQILNSGNL